MFSFIPDDMRPTLLLLLLGAIFSLVVAVVVFVKRKKLAYEVWIPILAISILSVIGLLWISICIMACFVTPYYY